MEQYIAYILEKDRETIFNPKLEEKVIAKILGDTAAYQTLANEVVERDNEGILPVEWVAREDNSLANFSFTMFLQSKKLMASELDFEKFKSLWEHYLLTADYYIQVANYMLNSDDYLSGERYKLKATEEAPQQTHKSNLVQNMKKLQASFQGHPEKESVYVQKVGQIGIELSYLIQN